MSAKQQPAVGIDLGTTFSVVAYLDPSGRPTTVINAEGDPTTPSVVLFDDNAIVVGKEALKAAALEPDRVAQFAKRDMGSPAYSRPIRGEQIPPEVIQSLVLEKLRRDAVVKLGEFRKVVITVPAYFNEPRRKATQDAGQLAGFEVLDIINEPTAAAIAFGVQQGFLSSKGEAKHRETILIYDLGGGTFDVTLMEIDGGKYVALATAGDVCLGGIDWDRRVVDHVAEQYKTRHRGIDPRDDPGGMQRLLRESEDAKRALTARDQITISFEHGGMGIRVPLSRTQFEDMTADLLERTRFTVANLLKEAKVAWSDITRILLVGGSTRMPMVVRMLEKESGKVPDRTLSVDEAVAHGAAIYAGLLLENDEYRRMSVRNVNSHNLGVLGVEPQTGRPRNKVMIPRNSSLPMSKTSRFKTHRPGQKSVAVKVIEGGDASGNNSTPIGTCVVRDLPPGLLQGTQVDVSFTYAANGRLLVHARLPDLGQEASMAIERDSGLSEDGLNQWERRIRNGFRPLSLDS
jgi:molecular chaperone DnaK